MKPRDRWHPSHRTAERPRLGARTPSAVEARNQAMRALAPVLGRTFREVQP